MVFWRERLDDDSVAAKGERNDLVTAADAEIEGVVRGLLTDLRPGDRIIGEEGQAPIDLAGLPGGADVLARLSAARAAHERAGGEPVADPAAASAAEGADRGEPASAAHPHTSLDWHVDPIDGTVNFVRGIEHFAFSVGVRDASVSDDRWDDGWLAGLVAAPALDTVWFAKAGAGAFAAPLRILDDPDAPVKRLGEATAPRGRVVATGFSYAPEHRVEQLAALAAVMEEFDDLRRCGSAAIDLCMAAEGRVNAYFERGLGVYDYAGGALIASEAGRRVVRRRPDELRGLTVAADSDERLELLLARG